MALDSDWLTTSGTATCSTPVDTITVTVEPFSAAVPARRLGADHLPGWAPSRWSCSSGPPMRNPSACSSDWAEDRLWPATSGTISSLGARATTRPTSEPLGHLGCPGRDPGGSRRARTPPPRRSTVSVDHREARRPSAGPGPRPRSARSRRGPRPMAPPVLTVSFTVLALADARPGLGVLGQPPVRHRPGRWAPRRSRPRARAPRGGPRPPRRSCPPAGAPRPRRSKPLWPTRTDAPARSASSTTMAPRNQPVRDFRSSSLVLGSVATAGPAALDRCRAEALGSVAQPPDPSAIPGRGPCAGAEQGGLGVGRLALEEAAEVGAQLLGRGVPVVGLLARAAS